jgi:NAD(P)-dependent dehydrogenase (short-subunit alcohol dehydrogenase family)
MSNTKKGKTVLIVGDGAEITREIALRYAAEGDAPVIIHTGVGTDETSLRAGFTPLESVSPLIIPCDSLSPEKTGEQIALVKEHFRSIDVLVFVPAEQTKVRSFSAYDEQTLLHAVEQINWPVIDYTRQIHNLLGAYPQYVIVVAPLQRDKDLHGCDFAAATHALNEVFVKYLTYHLFEERIVFNMIRTDSAGNQSSRVDVAKALFALTSGFMDAISGQTIIMAG